MATEDSSTHFGKSIVRAFPSAALSVVLLIVSPPVSLQESARGQDMTTEIVVTNDSDVENGDSSSVGGLFADPGPDGISLVEATHATNNDPGTYTIRFDPSNLVRNVVVRNNKVTGTLEWGIPLSAGIGGGGRRNRVKDVRVIDNVFRSTKPTFGAFIWTGDGDPYQDR